MSHRAIMNRLSWQWEEFPFESGEMCVFKTSMTFVDSVAEVKNYNSQNFNLKKDALLTIGSKS